MDIAHRRDGALHKQRQAGLQLQNDVGDDNSCIVVPGPNDTTAVPRASTTPVQSMEPLRFGTLVLGLGQNDLGMLQGFF